MKDLVIFGAGSVGRLSEQIASDINQVKKVFNIIGYLDDNEKKHHTDIHDLPVLGGMKWLEEYPNTYIALGFSNPSQKFELIQRFNRANHQRFIQLVHPESWISKRVQIGSGTIIYPGVHIDVDVKIGDFVLINKLSTLGHDTSIGNFSTISPGVNLGGNNIIGDGVDFGINSCSLQSMAIGSWSVIGAGAVIIRDVPDHAVMVGNPGRVLRIREPK